MSANVFVVCGVSGSGKSTIGQALSDKFGIPFYDGDLFHPKSSLDKMASGIPLKDNDRMPWLEELANVLNDHSKIEGCVIACSALKEKYRRVLGKELQSKINWVFLHGDPLIIQERMEKRGSHFFKPEMLQSQLADLEIPEYGWHFNVTQSPQQILEEIHNRIKMTKSELGLIGLGVMGKSLALNLANKGIRLAVYNRHVPGKEEGVAEGFVAENRHLEGLSGFEDLDQFLEKLESPKKILMMVNAGAPVDDLIDQLLPKLSDGDVLIDGGNSHYEDTARREAALANHNIHFVGCGISGGEEGALKGPSIMPGGSKEGYALINNYLEKIAAKDVNGSQCCTYIGPQGAGHFVKMVHNGIEYAEMQLIAELYHLFRYYAQLTPEAISSLFESWVNDGLRSYLLEITVDILKAKENGDYLLDIILDAAGQKGTGGWSTVSALKLGVSLDTISQAVMARNISGIKSQRVQASNLYNIKTVTFDGDIESLSTRAKSAYRAARVINHGIGFEMIREASNQWSWQLDLSEIARIWTNGCIIRSELMEQLIQRFKQHRDSHLLLEDNSAGQLENDTPHLNALVGEGLLAGFTLPVFSAAANYFNGFVSKQSSANMIQAQRDYFGAHTYRRKDRPLDESFHTDWKAVVS